MDNQSLGDRGFLRISAVSNETLTPISNATIEIASTGNPNVILERLTTDSNGNTETIELPAPPLEYSMSPSDNQPYSEYNT